jgi:hypothetical protein
MTTTFFTVFVPLWVQVNISANDGIILPFVSISTFTKQIDSTLLVLSVLYLIMHMHYRLIFNYFFGVIIYDRSYGFADCKLQ